MHCSIDSNLASAHACNALQLQSRIKHVEVHDNNAYEVAIHMYTDIHDRSCTLLHCVLYRNVHILSQANGMIKDPHSPWSPWQGGI